MSYQRRKILAALAARGFVVTRDTGNHTILRGPGGGQAVVLRHTEVKRPTAHRIAKDAGIEWQQFSQEIA